VGIEIEKLADLTFGTVEDTFEERTGLPKFKNRCTIPPVWSAAGLLYDPALEHLGWLRDIQKEWYEEVSD
jgi:hypothetical protein